jgi:hypothetical protein
VILNIRDGLNSDEKVCNFFAFCSILPDHSWLVGPSDIWSDANHIYSEKGTYNTVTGKADLYDRSVLTNQGKQLTGDTLFYDRNTGVGEVFSRMVMTDTINRNMLTGEYGYYNEQTDYAFATDSADKPRMVRQNATKSKKIADFLITI